ncbi:MAG: IS66 family insertion sequence hypothetical protein [Bacteroidetes bacterium]|nr:MAG: IS66 family insertion sequence hypothetical protein [Bacteroidota bacterium]
MFALTDSQKFHLYTKPADMRKSFNGLSGLVRTGFQKNPLSGEVFIFINKKRNMMKILHWQNGGFLLYFKRLEKGTFEILKQEKHDDEIKISYTKLAMIISGISVKNICKRKRFSK